MLKVYMLLIVLGILGSVGYGGYTYYKDTQTRIATLTANNAKLEVAAQQQEQTINTMIEDREKLAELNKGLQKTYKQQRNTVINCVILCENII